MNKGWTQTWKPWSVSWGHISSSKSTSLRPSTTASPHGETCIPMSEPIENTLIQITFAARKIYILMQGRCSFWIFYYLSAARWRTSPYCKKRINEINKEVEVFRQRAQTEPWCSMKSLIFSIMVDIKKHISRSSISNDLEVSSELRFHLLININKPLYTISSSVYPCSDIVSISCKCKHKV